MGNKKKLSIIGVHILRMRQYFHVLDCIDSFVGWMKLLNYCIKNENDFRTQGEIGEHFTLEPELRTAKKMAWYSNNDLEEALNEEFRFEVR